MQYINIPRQIQQIQILFDLHRVNIIQCYSPLCLIANLQKLSQAVGNSCKIDAVENVRWILSIPPQIAGGNAEVMGFPIL